MSNSHSGDLKGEAEVVVMTSEEEHCLDALAYLIKYKSSSQVIHVMTELIKKCHDAGISIPFQANTPYINTISEENEPNYPGDLELEEKIQDITRWNAMAMVVKANRNNSGLGGHISSYASCSTLYEVAQNHIFKGNFNAHKADQVFFQGHASPGNYARAFLEHRLTGKHLHNFRQELAEEGGLSSYPHPYLMPDFWQFPTVSMGLGPIMAIYQARFNRYLQARQIIEKEDESRVWCFVGDGECDEPEALGALTLASREKLNNLTFIINCNLQRLDGPVRGNAKMIQELESIFRGAGWNVIKVIWGSNWEPLLQSKYRHLLIRRMEEAVDGDYQKYVVEPGSYFRKHFFGKYPELLDMVAHLSDKELKELLRGGHDPKKVYTAYKTAEAYTEGPSVILAKTVKGYGLGEAGEGKNISHQQKKLNEKELREFRAKLNIPIDEDEVVETPFYRPKTTSKEYKYLIEQRKKLGGFLPERKPCKESISLPKEDFYAEFSRGSKGKISTTMALVRLLTKLLRDPVIGKKIVPIIPDEARTFGMESLFRQIGIYAKDGQLYEPVDSESLLYYRESKDGQILEEGINECGAMCSFISAGTSYTTHGKHMIPFYIYYSMFGFQRIGDLMWLAGDIQAKGFLIGGTAGRTTLNGEGLQHQDGHSHLLASSIPNLVTYDPAFAYEIAIIIQDGLKRMYQDGEAIFYYLTVGNENYIQAEQPEQCEKGILKGLYKFNEGKKNCDYKVQLFGSGSILKEALKAQEVLAEKYNVSADVWSATNYKQLRSDALDCQRWNMLHPNAKKKTSYLESVLKSEPGPFIAVSDNVKAIPDQIQAWVPGGLFTLGTDGFGRSESRENLRRFFEVDVESIIIATLYSLKEKGEMSGKTVSKAIQELGVDPEKAFPICV